MVVIAPMVVDTNVLVSIALTVVVVVDVGADTMQLQACVIFGHTKC
jgi:hypothetical protein